MANALRAAYLAEKKRLAASEKQRKAETVYGVVAWRSDGRYDRGSAARIFARETDANKHADKLNGPHGNTWVVRSFR